ncbi:hypothetical protein [Chitinophaga sp.]|uniref:hypothetical protein n=1 Tax=Chitinophaga sp. TaxID=1869181 RepID=UPI0031DF64FC
MKRRYNGRGKTKELAAESKIQLIVGLHIITADSLKKGFYLLIVPHVTKVYKSEKACY